ncbi:amino acid-binding ACT domain-containing protein [Paenochrobactrum sp. BZR 588]|uniref:amino acid-binding ACT domain-containing protein n=1 Tax=Paenochrobactrum TaxID=999488 RepID=UPI0035BC6307
MFDIEFDLTNDPDGLARLGEAMGRAAIPFEGGGVFKSGDKITAHFLFKDGEGAWAAAKAANIRAVAIKRPLIRKLKQGTPGQLGAIARALRQQSVEILTQYSDHYNRLILICDDFEKADIATREWAIAV